MVFTAAIRNSYNMHQQKRKTALILGATGLVGQQVMQQTVGDQRYSKVTCLLRKPLSTSILASTNNAQDEDKLQPIVIDFDNMQDYIGYFTVDHVYVCLGTTIKKAGSRAAFRKVDFEYVHVAAQLSRARDAESFVWISSVGANAKSPNFYLRVKGELENTIFGMSGLENSATVRPSLLMGERSESRLGENLGIVLGQTISPFLKGPLKKYRPVPAETVARQMINLQKWD